MKKKKEEEEKDFRGGSRRRIRRAKYRSNPNMHIPIMAKVTSNKYVWFLRIYLRARVCVHRTGARIGGLYDAVQSLEGGRSLLLGEHQGPNHDHVLACSILEPKLDAPLHLCEP
jgi:hypothetical protein